MKKLGARATTYLVVALLLVLALRFTPEIPDRRAGDVLQQATPVASARPTPVRERAPIVARTEHLNRGETLTGAPQAGRHLRGRGARRRSAPPPPPRSTRATSAPACPSRSSRTAPASRRASWCSISASIGWFASSAPTRGGRAVRSGSPGRRTPSPSAGRSTPTSIRRWTRRRPRSSPGMRRTSWRGRWPTSSSTRST